MIKKTAKIIHPNDVKDVLVNAPPAEFRLVDGAKSHEIEKLTKQILPGVDFDIKEIIELQQAAIRGLESDLQKTRMVTANIANAALCLYKMLLDAGYTPDGEKVYFSKELVDRMKGQRISIGDDAFGNRFVRVQERVNHPTYENRTDD